MRKQIQYLKTDMDFCSKQKYFVNLKMRMDYSGHSLQYNLYFAYLGQQKDEIRPVRGRDLYDCLSKSLSVLENHINLTEKLITDALRKIRSI